MPGMATGMAAVLLGWLIMASFVLSLFVILYLVLRGLKRESEK